MKTIEEWRRELMKSHKAGSTVILIRRDTLDAAIAAVRELRAPLTDKALRGVLLQGIDAIEALKEEP
jgi:hypothetical protein